MTKKELVKTYLEKKYLEDKEQLINYYKIFADERVDITIYQYTKGLKVIIDNIEKKAYSLDGYFYTVMLNDEDYLKLYEADLEEIINRGDEDNEI